MTVRNTVFWKIFTLSLLPCTRNFANIAQISEDVKGGLWDGWSDSF